MHWFEETDRVIDQVNALEEENFEEFKKLIKSSGDSSFKYLQNVYTNRDVQNQAVSIALAVSENVLGNHGVCRVHGGGFAGTIQAFVPVELAANYSEYMDGIFGAGSCYTLSVRMSGAIKIS